MFYKILYSSPVKQPFIKALAQHKALRTNLSMIVYIPGPNTKHGGRLFVTSKLVCVKADGMAGYTLSDVLVCVVQLGQTRYLVLLVSFMKGNK